MVTVELVLMIVLALAARLLVPQMMRCESALVRFGIGVGLFGMYTALVLLMFRYLCTYDGREIAQLTGSEVWERAVCGMLLTNVAVLFAACIFFFTREKRSLSQSEKMKLKDL